MVDYIYNPTTVYIDPSMNGQNYYEYIHEEHKMHPFPQFVADSSDTPIDPSPGPEPPDPDPSCHCKVPEQVLIDEDDNGIPDYADRVIEDVNVLQQNNTWVTI